MVRCVGSCSAVCGRGGRCAPREPSACPRAADLLRDVVLISERPAEAEDRAVPGHWEGDLLLGKRPSAVVTLVERASRYLTVVALPDGYKAEQVRPALAAAVARLPEQLRRSLTWDQGKEMAEHARFTVDTGVAVYFVIRAALGSAAATRTPMDCSANTCPRAATCASSTRRRWMPSRPS